MSIDLLFELQQDVRRLFIAGSGMASGDLRLQKVLPQLQKLGESAPVFNRMAQAVSQVLEAETSGSATKLLELGTLLSSVLYTQGKTETKETLLPVEGSDTKLKTLIPYRKLQPFIEALTQKGQGRMEQLRQGYEEELFRDFRVIPAVVSALDDSYAEIPDFLQMKVLPAIGVEALPALQQQLKLGGGKGDARRLELIHGLQPASSLDLLLQAAANGSTEVRSAAIELLGDYTEQEEFLLEQAEDKKKDIRRAALMALSRLGTEQAIARLYQALSSKDQDIAIEPIQLCKANALTISIIAHAEGLLEQIKMYHQVEPNTQQLMADIRSLQGKRVPEVVEFLEKLLSTPEFIIAETERVQEAAVQLLLDLDLPEADHFAVTLHEAYNRKFIAYSFRAAVKISPPEDVYERFCHDLKDKKQLPAKELLRVLDELTPSMYHFIHYSSTDLTDSVQWDPRWGHLLVKLDEEELVCRFAQEPDPKIIDYLVKKCQDRQNFNLNKTTHTLLVLFNHRYPDAPELLMTILEKGGTKQFYYLDRVQLALLHMLPRPYAGRLRQFAEGLSYQGMKTQLLEIAESIEAKPEQQEISDQEEKGQGLWGWIKSKML
ncbi:HEAT repeat domain-containing protein [Paenibacillus sp. HWE-109]|uniref:HEAT repeat domain-containing protein n=1 Tax=Paenibacillus sp. HWE-109 TaxID=1306526 RepID=UPI001EDE20EF|nr:HEAT repeat domain-containing protein [Paenibacillus sp. HWE-109]UKS24446.1 HEAT repeat domain-containing protein [Paenibacillus sp. HWE-109]